MTSKNHHLLLTSWASIYVLILQCLVSKILKRTCCKVWRTLPLLHPSRWCGWHLSQLAGCWSKSGSHQEWSSSDETWEMRSTASPGHEVSRRGHSYKLLQPEETPPDQDTNGWNATFGKAWVLHPQSLMTHLCKLQKCNGRGSNTTKEILFKLGASFFLVKIWHPTDQKYKMAACSSVRVLYGDATVCYGSGRDFMGPLVWKVEELINNEIGLLCVAFELVVCFHFSSHPLICLAEQPIRMVPSQRGSTANTTAQSAVKLPTRAN